MSFNLWKFFLEDDVDGFRQYLARATYAHGSSRVATASTTGLSFKIGSPGNLATSPKTPSKPRRIAGGTPLSGTSRGAGPIITRADINARDSIGRTLLHLAASSGGDNANEFVKLLLEVPTIDLYIQDAENGWTALHRALYVGNIEVAQALLTRDILSVTDFSSQFRAQIGGLIKIKDHEGNSPFEVFGLTIAPRSLIDVSQDINPDLDDNEDTNSVDVRDDPQDTDRSSRQIKPQTDLHGDDAFAFGSNKNLSLGLGDEDDRQFPERIHLERPEHLLWRLYENHKAERLRGAGSEDSISSVASLHQPDTIPAVIRYKALKIQDIVMAKLHTAILTDDPVSNLHICGFGPGGRLGTGDEITRFDYVCIQGGGLASRRVSSIALGQDHCVAICSSGDVYTWGSNRYGQLGYVLPEVSSKETPMQLVPRQLYGLVKKEAIIGAAASSIHSVIYTSTGLYTFGKNEGQLGLMDADARSLQIQDIPRRVGVSLLQSPIRAVSAIDRATTVLLENRDVLVFTHYGFTKVLFPIEESNIFLSQALPTQYSREPNRISKITGGGNTIGALSSFGQVFTVDVPKPSDSVPSNVSTTNPTKARNALPVPSRVWSLRKSYMAAIDVAIGQDGSIILCTEAGAIWKKEKRANIKSVHAKSSENARPKDYKFVRVPYLTRAIAVRSNAFGAFMAVRKDCDVTREQIYVDPPQLLGDLFQLLPFHNYGVASASGYREKSDEPQLRLWLPSTTVPTSASIQAAILKNRSAEEDFVHISRRFEPLSETQYDVWIKSNVTDVHIPVHSTLLKARSKVLRSCLATFHETYYFSIPEVISIEYGKGGEIELTFLGADFLTLVNFVLYLYTETLVDVWHHTSKALHLAPRYRQVRIELMKIAHHLELRRLERAVRVMVNPEPCLAEDFELAYMDLDFYSNADIMVDLADGAERPAHSFILSSRCPFFEGLFHGRAAGMWLKSRRRATDGAPEPTRVDLRHVDAEIFDMVMRYIYADTAEELFDHIVSKDLDEFIDIIIEVMSVANELMLDRLVQICQGLIGKYVTPRNVCGLLNAVAESSIDEFKRTALEYLCLNLEGMLEQRLLSDLDQYLLEELNQIVRENQLAFMPFVRSNRARDKLIERHPELAELLERSRQRRIDSMRLQTRFVEDDVRPIPKLRIGSYDKFSSSPSSSRRLDLKPSEETSPRPSPALTPNDAGDDLPFNMDEDSTVNVLKTPYTRASSARPTQSLVRQDSGPSSTGAARADTGFLDHELTPSRGSPDILAPLDIPTSSLAETRVSGFEPSKVVWNHSTHQGNKADLKQIMEQASASRISNLTQAVTAGESSRSQVHKVSQKERKRQQQRQQQHSEMRADLADDRPEQHATSQSPWTKVVPPNKPDLHSMLSGPTAVNNGTSGTPTMPRPSVQVRQTTGNLPQREKEDHPKQKRSVSSTATAQVASSPVPQIQSIRHTPIPMRSTSFVDSHTSMADILAQQLGEKAAIREAAAKRSLQEIQQEQEFQEWWDQESQRVQEEEARANAVTATRNDKAGRGKGSRRRGSGRGGTTTGPKDRDSKAQSSQSQGPPASSGDNQVVRGGGETRGRGNGRGRARGKVQAPQ